MATINTSAKYLGQERKIVCVTNFWETKSFKTV